MKHQRAHIAQPPTEPSVLPSPLLQEEESGILEALKRGDKEVALNAIDSLYGDSLYRFIRGMMGDAPRADDVYQTTLVQIFRDLEHYAYRSSLRAWTFAIARHRCLDAIKSERRRNRRVEAKELPTDVPSDLPLPSEHLDAARIEHLLETCIEALSPKFRAALLMRYQENMSYDQIAQLCDEKAPAIRARVSRALPQLRTCMKRKGAL